VDPEKDEVTYVNAGHNPPLVYHCSGTPADSQFHWLSKTGMALGIVPEAAFYHEVVRLASGDFMLMYTDGVVDTLDPQGNPFGVDKLQTIILENCNEPAFQLVHALEQALANHVGGLEPFDDITILAVKRL
jgi:phosphoserine phosphatase RsbU/P